MESRMRYVAATYICIIRLPCCTIEGKLVHSKAIFKSVFLNNKFTEKALADLTIKTRRTMAAQKNGL